MTIYQKAIKLRKHCENKKTCEGCNYMNMCKYSSFFFKPIDKDIETVAQAIQIEKWKVK